MKQHNKRTITTYIPSPTSKPVVEKKMDVKDTPNKTNEKSNGAPEVKIDEFGGSKWCAAESACTNTLKAATSEVVCSRCKNYVHNDCCKSIQEEHNLHIYCLKCLNKSSKIAEGLNYNGVIKHGNDAWCGAREHCCNNISAATKEHQCQECKYNVHSTCFILVENVTRCLWCYELYENENEEVVNRTVTSSEYDVDYQSDSVIVHTEQNFISGKEEEEIKFEKEDEEEIKNISLKIQV
jgi:hypothetical protein